MNGMTWSRKRAVNQVDVVTSQVRGNEQEKVALEKKRAILKKHPVVISALVSRLFKPCPFLPFYTAHISSTQIALSFRLSPSLNSKSFSHHYFCLS
jgi:hypothetical protein